MLSVAADRSVLGNTRASTAAVMPLPASSSPWSTTYGYGMFCSLTPTSTVTV
ncbi:hypothetical protein D3C76_550130 [compost metagenome]